MRILEEFGSAIESGRIIVHATDKQWVGSLRYMFPVRTSGVRWEELPTTRSKFAETPRVPVSEKAGELRGFLMEFGVSAGMGQEDRCIVFGDGETEVAFEMPFSELVKLAPVLFALPHAVYVLTLDSCWCFSHTFEEDMYFARSPRSDSNTAL